MKTTIKNVDGENVNIADYRKLLEEYPMTGRAYMGTDGSMGLCNIVYKEPRCGCKITGCGTLQFPLSITFCDKHKKKS